MRSLALTKSDVRGRWSLALQPSLSLSTTPWGTRCGGSPISHQMDLWKTRKIKAGLKRAMSLLGASPQLQIQVVGEATS